MLQQKSSPRSFNCNSAARAVLAILLVICLAECVTEQRINSRGSKATNPFEKVNGWRSQRGGSCLSYGHSCWGAHGKRSGKQPSSAPDWYITRMLRRMAAANDLNRSQHPDSVNGVDAIYRVEVADEPSNRLIVQNENTGEIFRKAPLAKPMLDGDALSKLKIWEIMRAASEEE